MSPPAPNPVDAAALADELARFRVVDPARMSALLAEFPGDGPDALAEYLVRRGALTHFQADRGLAGEAAMLALGPYRLTDVQVWPLRSLWRARQAKQLARTFAALPPHPSVVPLVAADSAHGFHYLAWPLVEGPSLADRVAADGPLPPGEVAAALAHLLAGLAALHARRAVHGVITPRAVVLPAAAPPQLLELGAGTILAEDLTADEALFDTLAAARAAAEVLDYAAPELVADPTRPTPAADQFALGAVGYFALTGRPPFPGPTLTDRLLAREDGPPAPVAVVNPDVPAALAAVIDRMLRPDPADRFALPEEAREELAAVAAEPVPPVPTPATPPPGKGRPVPWRPADVAPRPPARDDSAASVTFELPPQPGPDLPVHPVDTPRSSLQDETERSSPIPAPGRPAEPVPPKPPSPAVVAPQPSPAQPEDPTMAKPRLLDAGGNPQPIPAPPPPRPTDPRLSMPEPVHWHTTDSGTGEPVPQEPPPVPPGEPPPPAPSVLWRKVKRNLLFWQAESDAVLVSVFGPVALTPGQTARIGVVLHTPEATESVRTLARAFQFDAELLGTGPVIKEIARETELAVHLAVTNAGLDRSLVSFVWRGQPERVDFNVHVPWESPGGPAPGLVSVGRNNVRIGKIEFRLKILPRKG